mmetsp:Transcript_22385/g.43886  ORF Transcript_22385/g.43886 Transcript_22385/m.43886 type:complete len:331 (+) Transcript_22385:506-1498(+)|eukprot:CAMPEP_0171491462 /NCGR_PEP_ID=MMETSP0958-20121227/3873_1 /TAXON_ID=87120 /ORGANISM="Aurantiochytrium limacinum, Strain ATCCMYA-1381" /LENGTH=330 /DNA_ID=CAMNT_0012024883 /DNA_START=423 /DNA_END=1415 /DNA_ORIENTATION=-
MLILIECAQLAARLARAYWAIALTSTAAAVIWKEAADWSRYGKLRGLVNSQETKLDDVKSIGNIIRNWTVPKRWFAHFYEVCWRWALLLMIATYAGWDGVILQWMESVVSDKGILASSFGIVLCKSGQGSILRETGWQRPSTILLLLVLQARRRLYEENNMFVSSSEARMHVFGYFIGLTFYLAYGWSTVFDSSLYKFNNPMYIELGENIDVIGLLGIIVFIVASYEQHRCHRILAGLRNSDVTSMVHQKRQYFMPKGRLFEYVSCPHYFTEVLIYLGLALMDVHNVSLWLAVMFTGLNLGLTAVRSHSWYKAKFEDYPAHRKAFIPFIV